MNTEIDWMDKYSKQVMGYKELDKFKPGDSLHLQYYPVPEEEIKAWQKEKDRIAMQNYEEKLKQQEETKKALLELREEETRENGHNTVKITRDEKGLHLDVPGKEPLPIPEEQRHDKIKSITTICKDCDKHTIFCECNKEKQQNPSHCDLKKQSTRRKSKNKK